MTEPLLITSRDNPLLKELRKLAADGAAYRKTGRVWIEGEHLCSAYLQRGLKPSIALVLESKQAVVHVFIAKTATKIIVIPDHLMAEISALDSLPSLGFMCDVPAQAALNPSSRTVVLDRLQDPGNVGSILRSAAAFGFTQVVALKGSVALWAPKVLRAGMGAHFGLHLVEAASVDDIALLQHPLAVTSSHEGELLHQLLSRHLLPSPLNWVMGHEGQGVSTDLIARAQLYVRIAQPGGEESLNVAAAAAICLHASASVEV